MSRPRLTIGTFGTIGFQTTSNGSVTARARYRDWDGKSRLVQATGDTKRAAEQRLKAKLAERTLYQPAGIGLTADNPFPDLVAYWLEDLDLEDRLSTTTRQLYERNMRTLVMPAFKDLTSREIGVARCDHILTAREAELQPCQAGAGGPATCTRARGAARGAAAQPDGSRLAGPETPTTPNALTPAEVNAIRTAIASWETGLSPSGPKPDGQLGAIVEVMLGTSARISEVLAIRRRDDDIVRAPPSIRISGTIVAHRGEPTQRQGHPETAKLRRTVALPAFVAEAVRLRLARRGDASLDALLFCNRDGGPLTTNNVRRQLRHVLDLAGVEGVTPHIFRRTVATAISNEAGVDLAAELLGHTDPAITVQHYICRNEMVNPATAEMLERAFGWEW